MKNKLKEMLLQHKPITEQTFDIEATDGESFEKERLSDGHTPESIASLHNVSVQDILDQIEEGIKVEREHTSDKAEARLIAMDHLVELPDYYIRLDKMEEEGKKDLVEEVELEPTVLDDEDADSEVEASEEVVEDVPAEENSHTVADAIEESFLIPKSVKNWYYNDRVLANSKKLNKNIDKLKKAKGENADADTIKKLEAKVSKNETKLDYHEGKHKESHDERYKKLAKKILYKPGKIQKIIRDPRKLRKVADPSLFVAQVENMAKADREITGGLAKATSENRNDAAVQAKQVQQAGQQYGEEPKVAPKVATTTVQPTAQTYHQKVASKAAAVREKLNKVRESVKEDKVKESVKED